MKNDVTMKVNGIKIDVRRPASHNHQPSHRYAEPIMTTLRQQDFIDSIADALQFISYYHPADFISSLAAAYEREESTAAKDAMAQILSNSRMCAQGHRPVGQDTG